VDPDAEEVHPWDAAEFFRTHLPPLSRLRHLAFHNDRDILCNGWLQHVCAAAKALLHLKSLHLVRVLTAESHRCMIHFQSSVNCNNVALDLSAAVVTPSPATYAPVLPRLMLA
jgi:hypothetical protein